MVYTVEDFSLLPAFWFRWDRTNNALLAMPGDDNRDTNKLILKATDTKGAQATVHLTVTVGEKDMSNIPQVRVSGLGVTLSSRSVTARVQ